MIIPAPGCKFLIGDFASIEARITFWLAGCTRGLELYKKNIDVYKDLATKIYGVKYAKVTDKQRDIGKRGILGLGFGMGFVKFISTCWTEGRVRLSEAAGLKVVNIYRKTYPEIPEMWRKIENCFKEALKNKRVMQYYHKPTATVSNLTFLYSGNSMKVTLPSGRIQYYFQPRITESNDIAYRHPNRGLAKTWGGSLVENIVQGIARDLMACAMFECDDHKLFQPVLTVHDEIINEVKTEHAKKALPEFQKIMSKTPGWAAGLPMAAECVISSRYRKI